ncbi:uncharacterized protein [Dermacentor andersoni]|uniref:uncharacterized protein n=1 Tax=Dermacentor andersoni TaxID=34620 RepID=UPI003B3A2DA3
MSCKKVLLFRFCNDITALKTKQLRLQILRLQRGTERLSSGRFCLLDRKYIFPQGPITRCCFLNILWVVTFGASFDSTAIDSRTSWFFILCAYYTRMAAAEDIYIDNERLISAVEARTFLWLSRHRDHKNRQKKAALWREVAAIVLPGVQDGVTAVQKRWKSLRDKFRRCYNDATSQKSGAGAEEESECSWPFFELLMFLRDTMETRATSGNFQLLSQQEEPVGASNSNLEEGPTAAELFDDMCHFGNEEYAHVYELEGQEKEEEDVVVTEVSVPPAAKPAPRAQASSVTSSGTPTSRKRKVNADDLLAQQLQRVTGALETTKPTDHIELFAMSLVPLMKRVRTERQTDMYIKILNVIKELTD